jgi:hypothetical protein
VKRGLEAYHVRARDCAKMQRPFGFKNELYRQHTTNIREKCAAVPVAAALFVQHLLSVSSAGTAWTTRN